MGQVGADRHDNGYGKAAPRRGQTEFGRFFRVTRARAEGFKGLKAIRGKILLRRRRRRHNVAAMPKPHPSRADFDSPWKESLDYFLAPFLAFFFPQVHTGIDWSKGYESLDKEFHQIALAAHSQKALADKLFKVWRLSGEETW